VVVLVVEVIAAYLIAHKEQELLGKVLMAEKVWAVKGSLGLAVVVVELVRLAERQVQESVATVAPEKTLQYLAVQ
jgi:cytochrome b561